jgi:hypothetical protein
MLLHGGAPPCHVQSARNVAPALRVAVDLLRERLQHRAAQGWLPEREVFEVIRPGASYALDSLHEIHRPPTSMNAFQRG